MTINTPAPCSGMTSILESAPSRTSSCSSDPTDVPRLSNELLAIIRDTLEEEGSYRTLTSLASCSRTTASLVGACLPDPGRLVLGDENVDAVFGDILGYTQACPSKPVSPTIAVDCSLDPCPAEANWRLRDGNSDDDEALGSKYQARITRIHHHRVVARLEQCRHLTITSYRALEALVEASELIGICTVPSSPLTVSAVASASASGSNTDAVWQLDHLCLSGELVWAVSSSKKRVRQLRHQLATLVRARHVCGTMYVPAPPTSIREGDHAQASAWETRCRVAVPQTFQRLIEEMKPERVTVHNLTVQDVPAIYSRNTRLFFRLHAHAGAESGVSPDTTLGPPLLAGRAKWEICDELGAGLLGMSDGEGAEMFEVIGLDDPSDVDVEMDVESKARSQAQSRHQDQLVARKEDSIRESCNSEAGQDRAMEEAGGKWMTAEVMTLHRIGQRWVRDLLERSVKYTMTRDAEGCEACGGK